MGWKRVECWSTKSAISVKGIKIDEKLLWRVYRNLPTLFWTVHIGCIVQLSLPKLSFLVQFVPAVYCLSVSLLSVLFFFLIFSFSSFFLFSILIYIFLSTPAISFSFLSFFTFSSSYFSLAPCARLNWQFSDSFQAHLKSSSIIHSKKVKL